MRILSLFCCSLALALLTGCTGENSNSTTTNTATDVPITSVDYQLFHGDGSKASWQELIAATKVATVTFLGEMHDDPVAHHLEQSILRDTLAPNLALSLEMFETDVQYVLDEYLAGQITEEHLIKSGRAWDNYDPDYRPLIEFARANQLPVLAANAPRRYVNIVSRLGPEALETLDARAKSYLPPLPYAEASPAYAEKFFRVMAENRAKAEAEAEDDADAGMASSADAEQATTTSEEEQQKKQQRNLQAQSLWDAGMAHSITAFLERNPAGRVLHINGSFHSAEHLGIPERLARYRPDAAIVVITMVSDPLFPSFDRYKLPGLGDFIIVTDPDLQPVYAEESP